MLKPADKEKIEYLHKLVLGLEVGSPAILLMAPEDDFCMLQLYIVKFLQRDCFIFIWNKYKEDIKLPELPKYMTVHYYEDKKGLEETTLRLLYDYKEKMQLKAAS